MSSVLRIAFCTDGIFPHTVGGMQRHSRLLLEELARRSDLEIEVIHPHFERVFPGSPRVRELRVAPLNPQRMYLPECYRYSRRVAALLAKGSYDVVYSQGLSVWHGIGQIASPVVLNPHGLEPFQPFDWSARLVGLPFRVVFRHLFRKATRVVSLGGRLSSLLQGVLGKDSSKIVCIPNGVLVPPRARKVHFSPIRSRFLFVGRYARLKGIQELNQAILSIEDKSEVEFDFVGPIPDALKIQQNNINYHGLVRDDAQLAAVYSSVDALVCPSLTEGMPTVILEAMAQGLPVIATDVGATSELVGPDNGFLIPAGSVPALKRALLKFHALPTAAKAEMASRSHAKVMERFTWPKVAEAHLDLFRSLHDELGHQPAK